MNKVTSKQIFKKLLVFVGAGSFLFASIGSLSDMLANSSSTSNSQQEQLSPEAQLKEKAEGYELVLAREPDNPFVLENLLAIYLELRDLEAALPLAEKLVALQPENVRYQSALTAIQKGIDESTNNASSQNPSSEEMPTEEGK
jgi:hypothetical protein